jgi:hypothetical protein
MLSQIECFSLAGRFQRPLCIRNHGYDDKGATMRSDALARGNNSLIRSGELTFEDSLGISIVSKWYIEAYDSRVVYHAA